MARHVNEVAINQPEDFVDFIMNDYIQKGGFKPFQWKGEPCFRCGDGFFEACKYFKWSYANGVIRLEAWMKGAFGKESGLEGFVGAIPKKIFKSNLEELVVILQQPVGQPGETGNAGPYGAVQVKSVDHSGNAAGALVLGIVAILMCWIPLLAVIAGCVAFGLSRSGMVSSKKGLALGGRVCAIIGMIFAVILWVFNIIASVAVLL